MVIGGAAGLSALGLVAFLALAMTRGVGSEPLGETAAGFDVAPGFVLPDFNGGTFTLNNDREGPVFVYFWASWCAPCREEAPVIQRLWPEYRDRGYTFVGVNIIDLERDAASFIAEFGLDFTLVRDEGGAVYLDYGVYGLPESFFLRPDLAVASKFTGPLTESELRRQLDRLGG